MEDKKKTKTTLQQAIGRNLIAMRKESNLTQDEVCEYLNQRKGISISQTTFSKLEAGKVKHINLILLADLAALYRKSILHILPGILWDTHHFRDFINEYFRTVRSKK